jgi:BirA family biotin operon repressor/biotin-[acetyl-CoA-carboxylase] ligase
MSKSAGSHQPSAISQADSGQLKADSGQLKTDSFHWDGLDAPALARLCVIPRLELFDSVESTLDVAHTLAEQGAPSGTVIVADSQRAGRGRMGRTWSSEPGRGVWTTVIERSIDPRALEVLSVRAGLEIAERLDAIAGKSVSVKWPNDLVLGNSKLGGILVETRSSGGSLAWAAIGVGINVLSPIDQRNATGLRPAESRKPRAESRVPVLQAIVAGVRAAATAKGHLSPAELERFRTRDALRGRRIVEPVEGVVTGIESGGALLVETPKGTERLRTGTIRMAEGA